MGIIQKLVKQGLELKSLFAFSQPKAYDIQSNELRKLIEKTKDTAYGKAYNFKELYFSSSIVEDYRKMVPITDYGKMRPWWDRAYSGEADVCWPGKIQHFALSSGTSEGSSKYIPVSKDMIRAIKRTSIKQILSIARSDLPKEFITKHSLMVAGSTDLHFDGISYSGDLSGITTGNIPFWFQPFSKPDKQTRKCRNWEEKIEEMVNEARKWDVGMIAGVPAWIQILLEKIIERYRLNHIHDIWPNFKVYIHGGVAFGPYKNAFRKLLGEEIMYYETYLASEGFIAYQTHPQAAGMELQLKNGIYFEFVPFNSENFTDSGDLKENAQAISILEVEPHTDYALLISTVSGAFRYMIGDVIRFTSHQNMEIIISGRTKHFLSLCGEHLSVDNMTKAVQLLSDELQLSIPEFTVMGIPHEGMFAHHWFLAVDAVADKQEIKTKLDNYLKKLNDDYAVEREHALHEIIVDTVPPEMFLNFLREKGKMGAQIKFPRVLKGEISQEWLSFVQKNLSVPVGS
jgi:hypothetical protein